MNRKGFTLVELIATLAILGIVVGITIASVNGVFSSAKNKTEDVFVDTIKDAMEMYLNSKMDIEDDITSWELCNNTIDKTHGSVKMYKGTTTFYSVIDSEYKPITEDDLVNPANEDVDCALASDIEISIYRDEDYVYYYSVDKSSFGCLKNSGVISNLAGEFVCQ